MVEGMEYLVGYGVKVFVLHSIGPMVIHTNKVIVDVLAAVIRMIE
jgi:hypothetical protein